MASAKIILYTQKTLSTGEHPIILRIIKDRKQRKISIGANCSPELWDVKNNQPKRKHPYFNEICVAISGIKEKANREILNFQNSGSSFSIDELIAAIGLNSKQETITVFDFFDKTIKSKIEKGKVGYANAFIEAKSKLLNYRKGRDLEFSDVTPNFLKKYEEELSAQSLMSNTIFYYLRTFNTLLGYARRDKLIKPDFNPFKDFGFAKYRKVKTKKRAITREDLYKIENIELHKNSRLFRSRALFVFSYYCGGINFIDMAKLQWQNIVKGRLEYIRSKTNENFNPILLKPALNILEYFKERNYQGESSYIFPILSEFHKTPTQKKDRIKKANKQTNEDMREIASKLGITENPTTYVARHSFATIQKKKGTPTSVISEMMGHDSEKTTRIYLDSFGNDVIDEAMRNLL